MNEKTYIALKFWSVAVARFQPIYPIIKNHIIHKSIYKIYMYRCVGMGKIMVGRYGEMGKNVHNKLKLMVYRSVYPLMLF